MRQIGVHLGLGGGDEEALLHAKNLGCTAVQIFTHSPRSFQFKALDEERLKLLRQGWKELGINTVVSHCCYLINLGSSDNKAFHGSVATMKKELEYAAAFGCTHFVLHVGKYTNTSHDVGMQQVVKGLNKLADTIISCNVMVLLETVAGQGTEIGDKFEELNKLLQMLDPSIQKHVGICVDTCHIFAAGYDIRKAEDVVRKMEETFGVDRVKVIHANDSKFNLGERKDRHEHIGKGFIGEAGFKAFLNHPKLKDKPVILETPIDDEGDQAEDMKALRALL